MHLLKFRIKLNIKNRRNFCFSAPKTPFKFSLLFLLFIRLLFIITVLLLQFSVLSFYCFAHHALLHTVYFSLSFHCVCLWTILYLSSLCVSTQSPHTQIQRLRDLSIYIRMTSHRICLCVCVGFYYFSLSLVHL